MIAIIINAVAAPSLMSRGGPSTRMARYLPAIIPAQAQTLLPASLFVDQRLQDHVQPSPLRVPS